MFDFLKLNKAYPWESKKSIYSLIKESVNQKGELSNDFELPDQEIINGKTGLNWSHGSLDGVYIYNNGPLNPDGVIKRTLELCIRLSKADNINAKTELYNLLLQTSVIEFIDSFTAELSKLHFPIDPYFRNFCRWLLKNGSDREPVKFAIVLLGLLRDTADLDDIILMAKYEEFSLFGIVAIGRILPEPDLVIFSLAKNLKGWGKIHAVERLSKTSSSEIKDWLLREGYKNSVMDEYSAYTCAVAGDLKEALSKEEIQDELFNSASDLLQALIMGGPAKDIRDYSDSYYVIKDFLRHFQKRSSDDLGYFLRANQIKSYLEDDENFENKEDIGWTPENRISLISEAKLITDNPKWKRVLENNLSMDKPEDIFNINSVASILGIDIWESNWKRLQANINDDLSWYFATTKNYNEKNLNPERIKKILELAKGLNWSEMPEAPTSNETFGAKPIHDIADSLLFALLDFPSMGYEIIAHSIKSPVIRNRNLAIRVLDSWSLDRLNEPEVYELLKDSLDKESTPDVKDRIQALINKIK